MEINVAIIGGGGFIGATLGRMLAARGGFTVTPLPRRVFDLENQSTWGSLPIGTDCVIHAGANLRGDLYEMFSVNALSAGPLAHHLNAARVRKLIYLSTGSVYGEVPTATTSNATCSPITPYAISKYLAERVFSEAFKGHLNVLRIYFPYGPGQPETALFPRMAARIAAGTPIHVNQDGGPKISVSHVDDLSKAIIDDFVARDNTAKVANLASGHVVLIEDAAKAIAAQIRREVTLVHDGHSGNLISEPYLNASWRSFAAKDIVQRTPSA